MKTNRVTYFVLLAISVMLLTAGFVLYFLNVTPANPILLLFVIGCALFLFSLFGLIFNKIMNKHFCFKTFCISILPCFFIVFTAFVAFLFFDEIEFYSLFKEMNPDLVVNFDFILNTPSLLNLLIFSILSAIISIATFIATIFINIKIRKNHDLSKRGLFLDYGLAMPFCVFGLIIFYVSTIYIHSIGL